MSHLIRPPALSATRNSAGQPIAFPRKDGPVVVSVLRHGAGCGPSRAPHASPRFGYVLRAACA
jgi:hypothetical protein